MEQPLEDARKGDSHGLFEAVLDPNLQPDENAANFPSLRQKADKMRAQRDGCR